MGEWLGGENQDRGAFVATFQAESEGNRQSGTCPVLAGERSRLITQMAHFAQNKPVDSLM